MTPQALPETIPTDIVELTALVRDTPAGDRYAVYERLEKQLGDQDRAMRLYGEAESIVVRDGQIDALCRQLTTALTAAVSELRRAEGLLGQLTSPQVYDIEYAESVVADDLLHMVTAAHRSARIAVTLQKSIP
ncbi:hypothetical protein [Streptomyces noursei]|uniref:hypothetical protein n=1 Tax=Streptomyces noursei TaxID=1971 RepID=UPI001678EF3B|nr:hypothetical protein [Streptomyces noursei]MCZ1021386.1 hypothetical protein [Streptomyces noursei]GGX56371.1 hypothetical protein GCM10010341_91140 [Streptomyces noursei]